MILSDWADMAAIVSAMCDVIATGRDTFLAFYDFWRASPDINQRASALQRTMSTYSDTEVEAIKARLQGCRNRFIEEGSGERRKICLCSVLRDVKDGNGGTIPFDQWAQAYITLGCGA